MRRSLIIGFVIVLLLAEGIAQLLAPRLPGLLIWDNQFTQDKYDQIRETGPVSVVFAGSSVVNAGIDPVMVAAAAGWDQPGYNSAIPSTTPVTWLIWSRDVVLPELCPNLYVIGVSVRDYNDANPGVGYDIDVYSSSGGRAELYGIRTGASIEEQVGEYSALIRIRSRLRQPDNVARYLVTGSVPEWPEALINDEGRYLRWDDNVFVPPTSEGMQRLRDEVFVNFSVGAREDMAVRAMIEDARHLGMEAVIVRMPTMNKQLLPALPGGANDLALFDAQIAELGTALDVPVVQFPELDNRQEFFGDLYHMNLPGTELFSRLLGEKLAEVVTIPTSVTCGTRPTNPEDALTP